MLKELGGERDGGNEEVLYCMETTFNDFSMQNVRISLGLRFLETLVAVSFCLSSFTSCFSLWYGSKHGVYGCCVLYRMMFVCWFFFAGKKKELLRVDWIKYKHHEKCVGATGRGFNLKSCDVFCRRRMIHMKSSPFSRFTSLCRVWRSLVLSIAIKQPRTKQKNNTIWKDADFDSYPQHDLNDLNKAIKDHIFPPLLVSLPTSSRVGQMRGLIMIVVWKMSNLWFADSFARCFFWQCPFIWISPSSIIVIMYGMLCVSHKKVHEH